MSASLGHEFPLESGIYVSVCVYVAKHINMCRYIYGIYIFPDEKYVILNKFYNPSTFK